MAMLDFAAKVSGRAYEVDDTDYEDMRRHGFTDEDIWDVGSIAAFYAMSNRFANMANVRPNSEFYAMGRESRE